MTTFEVTEPAGGGAGAPTALVLPGAGYTAQAPLLWWVAAGLRERGWRVVAAQWGRPDSLDAGRILVREAVASLDGPPPDLVVAKSLGSFALPWALEHAVPGVWLTPLLTEAEIVTALQDADGRHLAVGGDADPAWRPGSVTRGGAILRTVPGADHGLEVAAGWEASARGQLDVVRPALDHAEAVRPR